MTEDRSHRVVEFAERLEEGDATAVEFETASRGEEMALTMIGKYLPEVERNARRAALGTFGPSLTDVFVCEIIAAAETAARSSHPSWAARQSIKDDRDHHANLIRCIFGSPFNRWKPQASWLVWNGGVIPKVAATAYEERALPSGHLDNTRLAVLADMLEEAGCQDAEVLVHLRKADAVHVRGCFVIDLILGKE
jgi:hypothetical protein